MRNEERIELFRTDDIAINCETKQEAKQFLDWCYENGMEWHASIKKSTHYAGKETCYSYLTHLGVGSIQHYKTEGFKIIKYKDFKKENQ